jgi:hypothetical protein
MSLKLIEDGLRFETGEGIISWLVMRNDPPDYEAPNNSLHIQVGTLWQRQNGQWVDIMPNPVSLEDFDTKEKAKVIDGRLQVGTGEAPPAPSGTSNRKQIFTGKLGSLGLNSGVVNLAVDGSTAPQEFYITADPNYDLFVLDVRILILSNRIQNNKFGSLAALNTGIDMILYEDGHYRTLIDKATTVGDMLLKSRSSIFGAGSTVNQVTAFDRNNDALYLPVDMRRFVPGGLRLGAGNVDRLSVWINDDISGLLDFYFQVTGYVDTYQAA